MRTMVVILLNRCGLNPSSMLPQPSVSEELQLSAINCFETIFRRATPDVIERFYIDENLFLFAQVLSMNEQILSNNKYAPVRYVLLLFLMLQQWNDIFLTLNTNVADKPFCYLRLSPDNF